MKTDPVFAIHFPFEILGINMSANYDHRCRDKIIMNYM